MKFGPNAVFSRMIAVIIEGHGSARLVEQEKHGVKAVLGTGPVAVELDVEQRVAIEPNDIIDRRLLVGDLDEFREGPNRATHPSECEEPDEDNPGETAKRPSNVQAGNITDQVCFPTIPSAGPAVGFDVCHFTTAALVAGPNLPSGVAPTTA